MNGHDLIEFIENSQSMRNKLYGIYSTEIDMFKANAAKPLVILNTEPDNTKVGHWVCMYMTSPVEFFDPLGHSPDYYSKHFVNFMINFSRTYVYSTKQVQGLNSILCGLYVLYFLHYRTNGYKFEDILSTFTNKFKENDNIVLNFYIENKHI